MSVARGTSRRQAPSYGGNRVVLRDNGRLGLRA